MIQDYARISFNHLRRTKVRSWITILGIVISIASIVSLLAISDGLTNAIEDQFAKIGSNKIFISAKGGHHGLRAGLTTRDVEVIERMDDFKFITPYLWEASMEVEYQKEKQYTSVLGSLHCPGAGPARALVTKMAGLAAVAHAPANHLAAASGGYHLG